MITIGRSIFATNAMTRHTVKCQAVKLENLDEPTGKWEQLTKP